MDRRLSKPYDEQQIPCEDELSEVLEAYWGVANTTERAIVPAQLVSSEETAVFTAVRSDVQSASYEVLTVEGIMKFFLEKVIRGAVTRCLNGNNLFYIYSHKIPRKNNVSENRKTVTAADVAYAIKDLAEGNNGAFDMRIRSKSFFSIHIYWFR